MAEQELTRIVRTGFERLCKDFTEQVGEFGFAPTRKTFWTRPLEFKVDFLHFHRGGISYGAPISAQVDVRIHLAIRVLNDDSEAGTLNGPNSVAFMSYRPRYHLRFNGRSFSQYDRCLADSVRFFREQGLPWFATFSTAEAMLTRADSPLTPEARDRLRAALATGGDPVVVAANRKLLGIRD